MFVKERQVIPKINLFFQWINSPSSSILQYHLVVEALKLYASDQTAEHGLKWTKCPAVRNFHQNATERFLQTFQEYQMFVKECQAIKKINLLL